ncbi:MAG TPA: 50S ribosomal protein L24 [Alphaproteobacteria bacterium]|nr:50S ribosomal protein L24 [Alphaproteobacteria bacterium]
MKDFSKAWISSKKPNKQRKYRFNAPLHIRGDFMNVHLSKDLRSKQGTRAVRVRTGDKVRIMRGQFKGQEGKVEEVNMKTLKVYISKIEHIKRDGTKARYPIQPSNLLLVELFSDDKKRFAKKSEKPAKAEKPVAEKKAPAKKAAAKPKAAKKEE